VNQMNSDLIVCVRAALSNEVACSEVENCISLAYRHGVMNLLYYAVRKMPKDQQPDERTMRMLKQNTYACIVREARQSQILHELFKLFEQRRIRCVPLKGAVLKELYPKPEMRNMSDIDLLIDGKQAKDVRGCFEELGCTMTKYDMGDTDQYLTPEGLNFEVKKTLVAESFNEATKQFTGKLLSFAVPIDGHQYICRLPNEEHYAYLLCHIVKHLINGGVGIRPIMDLWICNERMHLDREKLNSLLSKLDLNDFAQKVEHLANVWFGHEIATQLDHELGDYLLESGAFGTHEQRVVDRMLKEKKGNRFIYTLKRLFPPYKRMRRYFPSLKYCPILLPFYWIWRWIRAILFRRKAIAAEMETIERTDFEKLHARAEFYHRCGLNI